MTIRNLLVAASAALLVAACDGQPDAPNAPNAPNGPGLRPADASQEISPATRQQLDDLRKAVANFRTRAAGTRAGFVDSLTDCMSDPKLGAMGIHFGDTRRFDATLQHDLPEIIMFEPHGKDMQFVGVEFAVPFTAWTDPNPPKLFEQNFHRNNAFGLWVLHVWVGRTNPSGLFSDWNPTVKCPATTM